MPGKFASTEKSKTAARGGGSENQNNQRILVRGFELAFLGLFLTFNAMPRPRYRFQTLGVDLFAARNALPKTSFAQARESAVHQQK